MGKLTAQSVITLNNGIKIPIIGMGVYQTGSTVAQKVVENALKVGYKLVDSAQAYHNEEEVCAGISQFLKETPDVKREDVYYTTKVRDDYHGYESTKKCVEKSLSLIGDLKYIDLVLVHSPNSNKTKRLGTWKLLQEFVDAGLIKSIGVSNFAPRHIQEILDWEGLKYKPVINQVELSPWLMRTEVVDFCAKNEIYMELYSPLTRGHKLNDPQLILLAAKYGKSPAQILIRWSVEQGFICLPKSEKLERLAQNLNVFDFDMTEADIKALSHPESYEVFCWDPIKHCTT